MGQVLVASADLGSSPPVRKVAAVSGDARRALDICRRATELAERGPVAGRRLASPKKATTCLVTMDHVNAAIQEMFSSPKIMAIR